MAATASGAKRKAEWSHANKPKLSDILEDDFLGDVYLRFLESSLSAEVYMFYATAEKYKTVTDEKKRKRVFDKIVETFLVDGSEYEIDVGFERREALLTEADNPSPDAFKPLQNDVFDLMSRDLPRFWRSEDYKYFLENKPDTPEIARSRKKLEEFFGEDIKGPLHRVGLVERLSRPGYEKSRKRRRWIRQRHGNVHLGWANSAKDNLKEKVIIKGSVKVSNAALLTHDGTKIEQVA
mmetsp:Transcript_23375/g.58454  ORF Transcript_23375/g.58454 Transcript_23375/m.58454 type:complete len:237 (-) Transcript_23375:93-803(-)|eukprot:CAMPEP_0177642824 /NCGR_PEP_ID=MMETSP0447-20121125/7821_1 /TAXON_ID=0 /ORGANISM="Stygamoeba regulata, Strain BSH-02190019" /LENGTH=236 /DNA_ID=CAMNT_0019145065 /DNA_START=497 /DNA_END=1207 /DNA_ORIENTATION=+